jgi:hypothetical protein
MNTANTDALAVLDRIMPDPVPTLSPQEQHQAALKEALTAAQTELEELSAAIRLCDADIQVPVAVSGEIAALEEQRTRALASSYLKRKVSGVSISKLNADIEALKRSLEPLKVTAAGAAAARCELIAQQAGQVALVERLHRDLALSGALGPEAYRAALPSFQQEHRRQMAARQQETAQTAEETARQRAEDERQRRQGTLKDTGPVDNGLPTSLRNRPW